MRRLEDINPKKIGIITICDDSNYGNRLQNYAMQEIIAALGYEAISIRNVSFPEYKYVMNRYHFRKMIESIRNMRADRNKMHQMAVRDWNDKYRQYPERYKNFLRFNQRIAYSEEWLSEYKLELSDDNYEAFITGSDQVFNYKYGRANRIDFLQFSNGKPRIAVAASLGVDRIPFAQRYKYRHYLKSFSEISVREKRAKELLEAVAGVSRVKVVCDPVIAVKRQKWIDLSDLAECVLPANYVIVMYLGNCQENIEMQINQYAAEQDCSIVRLNHPESALYYQYGPYEFLRAVRNAQMVFTDSFHTCVFAMIFHTSFYVTRRVGDDEGIFSRISWLLEQYGLEDRILSGQSIKQIEEKTFVKIDDLLDEKGNGLLIFLQKAIQKGKNDTY